MNPTTKHPGFVYVIHATGTSRIKIGFSASPKDRLAQLQTGSPVPLQLLASWPGSVERERRVHRYLSQFRQSGEWFEVPPFVGLQIYELVTKGSVTRPVSQSAPTVSRKATSKRKVAIPPGIDRRMENGAIVLYRRAPSVSANGKPSSRRTYIGRIPAKTVQELLRMHKDDQILAVEGHIKQYENRKAA